MNAHPLSLIDDNEDNSSQTHISLPKYKKSIKEDDTSTENTLNNQKKYIFRENREKSESNQQIFQKPKNNQKFIFDFKNKFSRDNSTFSKKTSDVDNKPGLIDDSNENTKKQSINNIKNNINNINKEDNINVPNNIKKDKLTKNLIEKRDKKFSYHGKIYFFCAISMLLYQYFSYIYLIELPIIQSK